MWIKTYSNGSVISEERHKGQTWCMTPNAGIRSIAIICNGQHSPKIAGMKNYWHSRTLHRTSDDGYIVIAEQIQGQLASGKWFTITWNGKEFQTSVEPNRIGTPVSRQEAENYNP